MGLVITLVDSYVLGYDAVPDVLGWVLVVLGLRDLRHRLPTSSLLPLALLSAAVSLVLVRPSWTDGLPESTGWLLSLPQLVFSFLLCRELAPLLDPASTTGDGGGRVDVLERTGRTLARRLRVLGWLFVVAAVGPVLLYGGGVDVLLTPLAVLSVVANVALVYLVFRSSTVLHGPRPPRMPRTAHAPEPKDE